MGGRRGRSGQAALEYVLVFTALIVVVWALGRFVFAARKSAKQTADLVTSDYP